MLDARGLRGRINASRCNRVETRPRRVNLRQSSNGVVLKTRGEKSRGMKRERVYYLSNGFVEIVLRKIASFFFLSVFLERF